MLSKKEPELEDLENSQPIHTAKTEKVCPGENTKTGHKVIAGVTHGSNQPSQQKLGIDMGLYQEKHCQSGLKGTETGQNEGRLLDF